MMKKAAIVIFFLQAIVNISCGGNGETELPESDDGYDAGSETFFDEAEIEAAYPCAGAVPEGLSYLDLILEKTDCTGIKSMAGRIYLSRKGNGAEIILPAGQTSPLEIELDDPAGKIKMTLSSESPGCKISLSIAIEREEFVKETCSWFGAYESSLAVEGGSGACAGISSCSESGSAVLVPDAPVDQIEGLDIESYCAGQKSQGLWKDEWQIMKKNTDDYAALLLAEERIKNDRKGGLRVVARGPGDAPVSGLGVKITQKSLDFRFGLFTDYHPWIAKALLDSGFNYVPLYMSWRTNEPSDDLWRFEWTKAWSGFHRFREAGFQTKVTGVDWFTSEVLPDYAIGLATGELEDALKEHISELLEKMDIPLTIWELVNEPLATWANQPGFTYAEIAQFLDGVYDFVAALQPGADYLVNLAAPAGEDMLNNGPDPFEVIESFIDDGLPVDTIGLQMYYNGVVGNDCYVTPAKTLSDLDALVVKYAGLGLPLEVSELAVPSTDVKEEAGYRGVAWNEKLQAEYARAAYTLFFSRKEIEGIAWWDSGDMCRFGLFSSFMEPKPAFCAVRDLIKSWLSEDSAETDVFGVARLSGLAGIYKIEASDPETGFTWQGEAVIEAGKEIRLEISVPYGEKTKNVIILKKGELEAHFADNSSLPGYSYSGAGHPTGLNGIARLRHSSHPERDIFVPSQAGLNYELTNIKGVEDDSFEPRLNPIYLVQIGESRVAMYQEPTEHDKVEAELVFEVVEPHYVDFDWKFRFHRDPAPPGEPWETDFAALFASYMYDPEDANMYIMGHTSDDATQRWFRIFSYSHGDDVMAQEIEGGDPFPSWLVQIDLPCLAGVIEGMLFAVMIEKKENFGYWYSPDGGMDFDVATPAWDLNVLANGIKKGAEITIAGRLLVIAGGELSDLPLEYVKWK